MKISVAMATYNGAAFLKAQLDSLAAQDRLPDELVVSDDGSSDNTLAIVERFAVAAPFSVVVLPNSERLGVNGNFARALARTSGDVVALCDQDDAWFPAKIARVVAAFESQPQVQLIANDQIIADSQLNPSQSTTLVNYERIHGTAEAFGNGCCLTLRRSWVTAILPIPRFYAFDLWINSLATMLDVRAVIREPLQLYRRHGENVSQSAAFATGHVSRLTYFRTALREDAADLWRWQIRGLRVLIDHLASRRAQFSALSSPATVEGALLDQRSRLRAIEQRLQIRETARTRRLDAILRLLREGGYRHFSGSLSAIKDVVAAVALRPAP